MTQTGEMTTLTTKDRVLHCDPKVEGGTAIFAGTSIPIKSLFDCLEGGECLDTFLDDFPTVSREQAIRVLHMARAMLEGYAYGDAARLDSLSPAGSVIHSDEGTMWGTPVFKGSRMPMKSLFDHMAGGYTIAGFLACFDTAVTPEQAVLAIGMARETLESYAHETAAR